MYRRLIYPRRMSHSLSDFYLSVYSDYSILMRPAESLVVKGKVIIDDTPETAIKDYIIYLRRVNRGEIGERDIL